MDLSRLDVQSHVYVVASRESRSRRRGNTYGKVRLIDGEKGGIRHRRSIPSRAVEHLCTCFFRGLVEAPLVVS